MNAVHLSGPVRWHAATLLAAVLMASTSAAWGWNPFEVTKSLFEEVALTPAEWSQVHIKAGWATGYPDDLLFEVSNQLPGPMAAMGPASSWRAASGSTKDSTPVSTCHPPAPSRSGCAEYPKGR